MKYKKKLIQKIKDQYGVSELFFFKGYKRIRVVMKGRSIGACTSAVAAMNTKWSNVPIVICSFNRNPKKVYKNREDVVVIGRYTHCELEVVLRSLQMQSDPQFDRAELLRTLKFNSKAFFSYSHERIVLFEQWNTEFEDLHSLKQAYLIAYLAGI